MMGSRPIHGDVSVGRCPCAPGATFGPYLPRLHSQLNRRSSCYSKDRRLLGDSWSPPPRHARSGSAGGVRPRRASSAGGRAPRGVSPAADRVSCGSCTAMRLLPIVGVGRRGVAPVRVGRRRRLPLRRGPLVRGLFIHIDVVC